MSKPMHAGITIDGRLKPTPAVVLRFMFEGDHNITVPLTIEEARDLAYQVLGVTDAVEAARTITDGGEGEK